MNPKGFLARRRDGELRMTESQRRAVARAFDQALHRAVTGKVVEQELGAAARLIARRAIDAYPADRSCATCDFERGGHCLAWAAEIPPEAVDAGCERHQDDGAPF